MFGSNNQDDNKPLRALIPIDFTDDERKDLGMMPIINPPTSSTGNGIVPAQAALQGQERDKSIASKIPMDKESLFSFKLDWDVIRKHEIIKNTISPWVAKKVQEYLGESEETLCNFIITKLSAQSTPLELIGKQI